MIETKEEEKITKNYIVKKNKEDIKGKDKKKENKRSKWVHKEYMSRLSFREARLIFLLK